MTPSLTEPPTPQRFFSLPGELAEAVVVERDAGDGRDGLAAAAARLAPDLHAAAGAAASRAARLSGSRALRRSPSVLDQTTLVSPRLGIAATVAIPSVLGGSPASLPPVPRLTADRVADAIRASFPLGALAMLALGRPASALGLTIMSVTVLVLRRAPAPAVAHLVFLVAARGRRLAHRDRGDGAPGP